MCTINFIQILTENNELILSISALVVSLWTILTTRKHNRLTVKPILQLLQYHSRTDFEVSVQLTNDGIGPAILQSSMILTFEGKKYKDVEYIFFENFNALHKQINWDNNITYNLTDAYTLGKSEKLPICDLKLPNREVSEQVQSIISRISIRQKYEDIYGTKFVLDQG